MEPDRSLFGRWSLPVYFDVLGEYRGARKNLEELATTFSDSRVLPFLRAGGFREFLESGLALPDMIFRACADGLAALPVRPEDVDAVVLVTESLWEPFSGGGCPDQERLISYRNTILAGLGSEAGFSRANVMGLWMSGCANVTMGLSIVGSLVGSGVYRNVIGIAADRVCPGASRFHSGAGAILSDAAVCFLVSSSPMKFQIRDVLQRSFGSAETGEDPIARAAMIVSETRELCALSRSLPAGADDSRLYVADNLSPLLLAMVSQGMGVPRERLISPTREANGHAFSSDGLLNLAELSASGLVPGQEICIISPGPHSVGLWELSVTGHA